MTRDEGDCFAEFVAARWPELEAVALVALLDAERAREVTTAALTALRGRWSGVVEEGAPTPAARRELVGRLVEAPPGPADPGLRAAVRDPADAVPGALLDALAAESPRVRTVLAAETAWELAPGAADALLPRRPDPRAELVAARARLVAAHRAARAADGLAPDDDRLDGDTARLVHRLAATLAEPPDAAGLVVERTRRVRRRSVLAGGAVLTAAAVGGVAWAAAGSTSPAPPVRRSPRPAPSTAGPDDPVWASTTRWPPRGSLAGDPGVAALVATAGNLSRLLYAADAGPLRVVVATDPQVDDPLSSVVRAWSGPAGTAVTGLTVAELGYNGIYDRQDLVAVALPSSGGALVVTLARPDVDGAEVSLAVRPLPDGRIERAWQAVPMTEGVGAVRLERAAGPASRLRMAGYDGPLPHVDPARNGEDLVAAAVADVAACVDVPVGRLAVRTTRFPLPEGAMQEMMGSPAAGTLDVTAVTTPGGGVVRFASYRTGSAESYAAFTDQPLVVPARERDAPFVLQLGTDVEGRPRTIVTSPARAATVQVLGVDGQVLSRPTRLVGRLAVVTLTTSPADGSDLRIVVRAADGRVVRDAVHVDGRPLYDLSPEGALF